VTKRLLEAYPTVLPDGTGRHTAVIVPTTQAVDATGDTEIFTSQGFRSARDRILDEDSKRTVPNVSSAPGVPDEGLLTGTATPIEMGGKGAASRPDEFRFTTAKIDRPITGDRARGPKTDPLPPWLSSANSSASGVAMPGTPPVLEPLHQIEVAPDTQRDEQLAMRADRRRWGTVLLIAAVIGSFAVGGFLIGRRESRAALETPPATVTTPPAVTNALTGSVPIASAPASSAAAASAASSAPVTMPDPVDPLASSASAAASAVKAPVHRPRRPKPVTPEGEPKPEEPTTAPNPYDPPPP